MISNPFYTWHTILWPMHFTIPFYSFGLSIDSFPYTARLISVSFQDQSHFYVPKKKAREGLMWMWQGSRVSAGIVCQGEGGILQAPDSDVKLLIPENVFGCITCCISTNTSEIKERIPEGECVIAPMVGYRFQPLYGGRAQGQRIIT